VSPHHCPALLISAPASGQGKTSFTAALARLHRRAGRRVRVFKTGPDFLDPMVLACAAGTPVQQLDLWMGGEGEVRARLYTAAAEADLILVEGMMGLFDGLPSAADLAQTLGLPVLAVIDANALAQSFGAIALGLARYRPQLNFAGVAGNRVASTWHTRLLRESLPPDLLWFGALSQSPEGALPERHLGLVVAAELEDLDARINTLADGLARSLGASLPLPEPVEFAPAPLPFVEPWLRGRRIAVARDAAFCFIYAANIELLQQAGAELVEFSPLAGHALPDCDALWLPGGYPELHLQALAARTDLMAQLHAHVQAGKPLLAECGGLLALLTHLQNAAGQGASMAGLIPGAARVGARLAGLGLQQVDLPEGRLRGHSFHYADAEIGLAPLAHALDPNGAPTREAIYRVQRLTASFVHFYFPSNPLAACRLFME
jgi:cobyrinic acid a,c-diamide synthase